MTKRDYPIPLHFDLVAKALAGDAGRKQEGEELREELDRRSDRYNDFMSMARQIIEQEPTSWGARKLAIMLGDFAAEDEGE